MTSPLPRILFFSINGVGMGHLSRCLAYARRMEGRAKPVFFSLASAVEIIRDFGFDAEYFVSESWTRAHMNAWNRELAVRVGLMLEEVKPAAVVFDGTWPFHGFMEASRLVPFRVWSNRGLHKRDFAPVPVRESAFDLVIQPGEPGTRFTVERAGRHWRKVTTPAVTLLEEEELLTRDAARDALGLRREGHYALVSLGNFGAGNDIALGLIEQIRSHGFEVVWARTPIAVRDPSLPDEVRCISVFPAVRYLRAFDVFAGAAGYNTCCEAIQSAVPALLVPNGIAADDQPRRAGMVSRYARVVVSACETRNDQQGAVSRLVEMCGKPADRPDIALDGAACAADEILALISERAAA